MSTGSTESSQGSVVVMNVWYDPLAGIGQTLLKHDVPAKSDALRQAALQAARSEIEKTLHADGDESIVTIRMRRGPRLPDGARHAFVDWTVDRTSTRAFQLTKNAIAKALAWLNQRD